MLVKDETIMETIQQLSLSLSTSQLKQFVTVIESLSELLQVANEDTEKAYQMYLNAIQTSQEEEYIKSHLMPVSYGTTNVVPIKH